MPDHTSLGDLETFLKSLVPAKEEPVWKFGGRRGRENRGRILLKMRNGKKQAGERFIEAPNDFTKILAGRVVSTQ